jgi:hypothetical protein
MRKQRQRQLLHSQANAVRAFKRAFSLMIWQKRLARRFSCRASP